MSARPAAWGPYAAQVHADRLLSILRLAAQLLVLVAFGAAAGVVGSFLQASPVWGLPLALVLSLAVFVVCGWAAAHRAGAGISGIAWLLAVYAIAEWSDPARDLVLVDRPASSIWFYGGAVMALASTVLDYPAMAGDRSSLPPGSAGS